MVTVTPAVETSTGFPHTSTEPTGDLKTESELEEELDANPKASWKYWASITTIATIYLMSGALIFQLIEEKPDIERLTRLHSALAEERTNLLNALSAIESGILNASQAVSSLESYEASIDSIFEGSFKSFLGPKRPASLWEYYTQCYLFVVTLTSTVGYGNIAPRTEWGRIFCMVYALIGIPTMIVFIAQTGKALARIATAIYIRLFGSHSGWRYFLRAEASVLQKMLGTSASISTVLLFVFCYMAVGAWMYDVTESWGFVSSLYFCFITMTTIGFGDLIPEMILIILSDSQAPTVDVFTCIRAVYTWPWGLCITSTAIELIRSHYAQIWLEAEIKRSQRKESSPGMLTNVRKIVKERENACEEIIDGNKLTLTQRKNKN